MDLYPGVDAGALRAVLVSGQAAVLAGRRQAPKSGTGLPVRSTLRLRLIPKAKVRRNQVSTSVHRESLGQVVPQCAIKHEAIEKVGTAEQPRFVGGRQTAP